MKLDIDTFHDLARPFFGVRLLTEQQDFNAEAVLLPHREIIGTKVAYSNQVHARDPRKLRQYDTNILLLEAYLSGSSNGFHDGKAVKTDPCSIRVMDWSRPFIGITRDSSIVSLIIPHSVLGYDPSRDPAYMSFDLSSSRGKLLKLALTLALEDLSTGKDDGDVAISAVIGLLKTCLLGRSDWGRDPQMDRGRRALVESHVRTNLRQERMSIDLICRDLNMSRATLYRTFGSGGIDRFIREERLRRCFMELLNAKADRGAIRRIAERWGFGDAGNFTRSFKALFGISPSDCLGPEVIGSTPETAHPIHRILAKKL